MKNLRLLTLFTLASALFLSSCQKEETLSSQEAPLSVEAVTKINQLGFSAQNAQRVDNGYLVEGDIFLSEAELNSKPDQKLLRVGSEEQYRTNNLVTRLPRVITIRVASTLPSTYVTAIDEVVRRYNEQDLLITFRRVTSGGNIVLTKAPRGARYLASAGFPTSTGNPYNSVQVNSDYLGSNPGNNYLATILAHEVGHCIGFRHTDYADRSFSCGGQTANEGASTVGAIYIPGTAVNYDDDPTSWMLACIGSGVNRPFNNNDVTALSYLYK